MSDLSECSNCGKSNLYWEQERMQTAKLVCANCGSVNEREQFANTLPSRALQLYNQCGMVGIAEAAKRFLYYRLKDIPTMLKVKWLSLRHGQRVRRGIHGSTLELDLEATGIHRHLALHGTREPHSLQYYEKRLKELANGCGPIVLDIGANIGHFALLAAKSCPEGTVIALEPDPRNIQYLERNVEINGYENVSVQQAAVGAESGEAELNITEQSNHNHISSSLTDIEYTDRITVEMNTVDGILQEHGSTDRPVVLRMDTEGYEAEILNGAEELLNGDRPLFLFAEIHGGMGKESYRGLINRLRKAGLSLERFDGSRGERDEGDSVDWEEALYPEDNSMDWEYIRMSNATWHLFAGRGV